jgi:hypothetical protein
MTLQELRELLGTAEGLNVDEILEGVQGMVNEEKQRGITSYQAKDRELLSLKNEIKETGFNKDQHGTLKDYVKTLGQKAASSDEDKVTINSLNEKVSQLTEMMNATKAEQQAALQKATTESLRSKLVSSIGDKLYGAVYVIDSLLQKGDVKMVEEKPVWSFDGVDLDFNSGLEKFLKNSGDILKSTKTSGTGKPGETTVDVKDIEAMSVDEVAANLSSIKAELGIE